MNDKSHSIRDAIVQANRKLADTFASGNARALAELYTEDAILLPTGSEPLQGTASIADFWEAVQQMGIASIEIETREVDGQGATVIEIGQYTLRSDAKQLIDRGKYIVVWKFVRGEWKLHRDIWNSNLSEP